MVADDPFHEPPETPPLFTTRPLSTGPSRPILRVHSENDLARPEDHQHGVGHTQQNSGGGSGSRTPARRVQWTTDHIVNLPPLSSSPKPEEEHELQNLGADSDGVATHTVHPSNLPEVDSALERFQRRRNRPSQLSLASGVSSADLSDIASGDADEEDYDYRLDVAGEREAEAAHRHPFQLHHHHGAPDAEEGEHNTEQDLLDNPLRENVDHYVPLGETDGLPGQAAQDLAKAHDIVRAHTGRWAGLRRRVMRGSVKRKGSGDDHAEKNGQSADVNEKSRTSTDTTTSDRPLNPSNHDLDAHLGGTRSAAGALPPGGPTSVLGTLLQLQALENDHSRPGTGVSTATTTAVNSAATTPTSSRPPSFTDSPREEICDPMQTSQPVSSGDHSPHEPHAPTPVRPHHHRGWSMWSRTSSPDSSHSPAFGRHHRTKSAQSLANRVAQSDQGFFGTLNKFHSHFNDRPKGARSAGGTIGGLVASTGAMAAPLVPDRAANVINPRRPGVVIDKYHLEEPAVRPTRRSVAYETKSLPGTPMRVSSPPPQGSSPNNFADRTQNNSEDFLPRHKSADDMLAMRNTQSEKGLPTSDSMSTLTTGVPTAPLSTPAEGPIMMKTSKQAHWKVPTPLKSPATGLKKAEKWVEHRAPLYRPKTRESSMTEEEKDKARRRKELKAKREREKRKAKERQYIVRHVAQIIFRQKFLLQLARALMMFGSPSHRLETQIQATAKVLGLNVQVVYIPGVMLVSFADDNTHTTEVKFLKQQTGLDLGKLLLVHNIYWMVVYDKVSAEAATLQLDNLMRSPPEYNWWQTILIAGLCSSFIVIFAFYASFIDALVCAPLGMIMAGVQMLAAKNDLFSNVFEIAIATLISWIAAVLSRTRVLCYTAMVSGGVVLILPGYIVLTGALELAARNITAGAVRMGYSVIYSLFLGFGISIGAEIYSKMFGESLATAKNWDCSQTHDPNRWYQMTPSGYWYYLCVPAYALVLSLRNQQPLFAKELPVMVLIACAGWAVNHFSAYAFGGRSDIVSALGAFTVGILGNIYGRFFSNGASFPVMVTGILLQLPSGLSQGGIFNFAAEGNESKNTTSQYSQGFSVAQQLVSVAIGLTVGLFVAAVVTHPLGGSKRRGSGIFSF
ncbi:hypothetical protein A1Q2_07924 [Trichosporon asahii var. asahii CBS 8904]|uniref:Threonine/serine exporter-like N-terminal domain-containing protein n=1 Tax=Trichosporon asahii var. asahii (strain CBS 8904) TaxID=1220162 RepID=K1VAF4_TRIAC|nr:hypothetical protein A1Q2_07924 [Trichosporon asahii var. asahii CBS 8904]